MSRLRLDIRALLASLLVLAVACGKHEEQREAPKDPPPRPLPFATTLAGYAAVCSGSKLAAKPYEKHADKSPSKVVVFQKYVDDKTPTYRYEAIDGLGAIRAKDDSELKQTELVACVDLKKKEKTRSECTYYGGRNERWIMTYVVRVIDPQSGKELAKDEFELNPLSSGCTGSQSFAAGQTLIYSGADYGGRLLVTLLRLQADGVALPPLTATDLDDVCTGTPRPQAGAADAAEPKTVHVAYQPQFDIAWGLEYRPSGLPDNKASSARPTSAKYTACVTGKPEKLKQTCNFLMGNQLELYDGSVDVVIYETATGKVVDKKSFPAHSSTCPSSHKFWGSKDPYFGSVDKALYAFVAEKVGGKIPDGP